MQLLHICRMKQIKCCIRVAVIESRFRYHTIRGGKKQKEGSARIFPIGRSLRYVPGRTLNRRPDPDAGKAKIALLDPQPVHRAQIPSCSSA